jgi:hypothetical protein
MKKLRMLETCRIAVDGIRGQWYLEGEICDVPEALASSLIRDELAEEAEGAEASPDAIAKSETGPMPKKERGRKATRPE